MQPRDRQNCRTVNVCECWPSSMMSDPFSIHHTRFHISHFCSRLFRLSLQVLTFMPISPVSRQLAQTPSPCFLISITRYTLLSFASQRFLRDTSLLPLFSRTSPSFVSGLLSILPNAAALSSGGIYVRIVDYQIPLRCCVPSIQND